jgi:hypothetical protein
MSAVSKNVIPPSTARRTIGSAPRSSSIHALSPKLIIPSPIRETHKPDEPSRA